RASEPGGPRITHVVATYQKYSTEPAESVDHKSQTCIALFPRLLALPAEAGADVYSLRSTEAVETADLWRTS
ncbi:MAG: hypothetical protein WCK95_27580, partial [Alphaproteobacteria bacterium]